jgi:hypothetical protein
MLTGILIGLAAATVDDTFAGFNTLTQKEPFREQTWEARCSWHQVDTPPAPLINPTSCVAFNN